jgi:hypothetical protein
VVLGGLPLMVDGYDYQSVDGYTLSVTGEDATLGSAQAVTSVLLSMLTNGSLVSYDRDDNRAPSLIVEVLAEYDDGVALAKGEAALRAVCHRPTELEWIPPQAGAPTAVFDVVHSTLIPLYSDMDEINQKRAYKIDMQALPYARSVDETVFPAVETGSTAFVTITNADTTAGWSAWLTGGGDPDVITDVGSAIRVTHAATPFSRFVSAELAFAAGTLAAHPYLVFEYRSSHPGTMRAWLTAGAGENLANVVAEFALDSEWKQVWVRQQVDPGLIDAFKFRLDVGADYGGTWFEIRDVSKTAAPPSVGSRKQVFGELTIGGSERTQGSINIKHTTTDLGDVVFYNRTDDGTPYAPPMSPWITENILYRTAAADCVSGYRWDLVSAGGSMEWAVPAAAIPPGDYHVVVRIQRNNGSADIPLELKTESRIGVTPTYGTEIREMKATDMVDDVWKIRQLGTVTLPGVRVGTGGEVLIQLRRTDVAEPVASIHVDELWLFKTDGSLTIVEGLEHPSLKIVAPSLDEPSGAIWATEDDTMAESYLCSAQALSRQHHTLEPGTNKFLTVTSGVADATTSATAFKRWGTYPSE